MNRIVSTLLLSLAASSALAQQRPTPEPDERPSEIIVREEPDPGPDRISIDAGARLVSQYISRGVAFADEPSFQPYLTLTIALPELTGDLLTNISWFVGNWNSIQSGGPGLGQRSSGRFAGWYEADLYTGVAVELRERWNLSFTYYYYHSPGNSFATYSDLEWILSFDDSGHWEERVPLRDFTLAPALRITQEIGHPRRNDAFYVQPSLTPSFSIGDPDRPIQIRIPLVLGFADDYYRGVDRGDVGFGYFRTGITIAGSPFSLAGKPVTVSGGFDLWLLNDKVANGLDDNEIVGRIGLRWSF